MPKKNRRFNATHPTTGKRQVCIGKNNVVKFADGKTTTKSKSNAKKVDEQ